LIRKTSRFSQPTSADHDPRIADVTSPTFLSGDSLALTFSNLLIWIGGVLFIATFAIGFGAAALSLKRIGDDQNPKEKPYFFLAFLSITG